MASANLSEIAKVFFKLGTIAFGGPAAHIAMMDDEIIKKRGWMSEQHFLDLIGATNIIPGPNSTEMTMHCGMERGGWPGLFTAGACFIFPAVVITMAFAWAYQKYGELPAVEPFISGIKPAVIAIILSAVFRLGKKALKNVELGILGLATIIAALLGVNEIVALFACGFAGLLLYFIKSGRTTTVGVFPIVLMQLSNLKILLTFLKVGAILYGSGYVLFAFLDAELVSKGIMTHAELMDAIAVGQFTPGPVLCTATFIGWQLGGFGGSVLATLGMFLPSFIFVALLNPIVPKLRKSKPLSAFLDAVNIGAVAVIIAVCFEMGKHSLSDWRSIVILVTSLIVVFGLKKLNSAYIVIGGAVLGYLLGLI